MDIAVGSVLESRNSKDRAQSRFKTCAPPQKKFTDVLYWNINARYIELEMSSRRFGGAVLGSDIPP